MRKYQIFQGTMFKKKMIYRNKFKNCIALSRLILKKNKWNENSIHFVEILYKYSMICHIGNTLIFFATSYGRFFEW